jgi:hypothetical protein
MVSSEVQRTLVKSPPELWAEISDPESLARHLGEFGEIRITRVHPEQRVEWESDDAHGSVAIKPSGWGTKVKLTVTRELPRVAETQEEVDVPDEGEPMPAAEAAAASEPTPDEPEPADDAAQELDADEALDADGELDAEAQPQAELELDVQHPLDASLDIEQRDADPDEDSTPELAAEPAPASRRGFFARLFGRRRPSHEPLDDADAVSTVEDETLDERAMPAGQTVGDAADRTLVHAQAIDEPPAEPAAERPAPPDARDVPASDAAPEAFEAAASEPVPIVADEEPAEDGAAEQSAMDIAAEIRAAEEVAAEQVTAVLSGVLDRLGAAHHRPFSRS